MLYDLKSDVKVTQSLVPAVRTPDTYNGTGVGVVNYGSLVAVFEIGAIVGSTVACKLQYSADNSTNWTDVSTDQLNGVLAGTQNTVQVTGLTEVGLLAAAFVRPVITVTGATSAACSAVIVQGNPKIAPVGDDGSVYIA